MFPPPTQSVQDAEGEHNFRLTLAYDGTDFYGWQVQPGLPTIQGELAKAIQQVTGERVLPQGSGRTDTGVHAAGQTVSLALQADIPAERLLRALNRRLPATIRVLSVVPAPAAFHARAAVLHKTYEYRIFERCPGDSGAECVCPPALSRYAWDCRWRVQMESMAEAAACVEGTHEFSAFAVSDSDRAQRFAAQGLPVSHVRTIFRSAWQHRDGLLVYSVTGTGFLHHMVRNIVGTCVEAGRGRIHPGDIPRVLQSLDRREAGPTAPPQGLHLMRVVYQGDDLHEDTPPVPL